MVGSKKTGLLVGGLLGLAIVSITRDGVRTIPILLLLAAIIVALRGWLRLHSPTEDSL